MSFQYFLLHLYSPFDMFFRIKFGAFFAKKFWHSNNHPIRIEPDQFE
jgi:hypothetical protein